MENSVVETNKKKNLIIWVMACVIVLLIVALVYFVFINKDNSVEPIKSQDNKQTENNQTNNIKPFDESVAYDLLLKIGPLNKDYYSTQTVNVKDVDMGLKVGKAIELIERESIVSEQVVKEKYATIFNDNYSKVTEAFTGCELWSFDNNGNYKIKEGGGCGSGSISDEPITTVVSANTNGNKLDIVVYVSIFDLYEKHELRDYTNDKLILKDASINEKLDEEDELEKFNLLQYASKFQNYKFTFVLRNGNYVLYSIEPVNN